jgi:hypothetical protein
MQLVRHGLLTHFDESGFLEEAGKAEKAWLVVVGGVEGKLKLGGGR